VDASRSDPPTPRARAIARAAQQREQERAARRKERRIRRWERREQQSEEYRLREQQGLSPLTTPENSSSSEEEEEESDGRQAPREVESPTPVTKGRRGGRGASARDVCGGVRRWAVSRGGRAHRKGVGERSSGGDRRRDGGSRILEEEKAGLL
jgi:hypothetical protein